AADEVRFVHHRHALGGVGPEDPTVATGAGQRCHSVVERRRFVIGGLTVLALTGPATAQQAQRLWRIAYLTLSPRAAPGVNPIWDAFAEKMRELGYVEGQNLSIEWRSADGYADRLPALAAELVRLKPDVIVVPSTQTTLAAKQATTTIPIVM